MERKERRKPVYTLTRLRERTREQLAHYETLRSQSVIAHASMKDNPPECTNERQRLDYARALRTAARRVATYENQAAILRGKLARLEVDWGRARLSRRDGP